MVSKPADDVLVCLIRSALFLSSNSDCPDLSSVDWDALATQAQLEGLAPLLYVSLKRLDSRIRPPENFTNRLYLDYVRTTSVNFAIFSETAELLTLLQRGQIPVVLLKGVALANGLYDDIGIRMLGDLDMLVRTTDRARVKDLLTAHGYLTSQDIVEGFRDSYSCEQSYIHSTRPYLLVDVHWHLFNFPYFYRNVAIDWFWQRTVPVRIGYQTSLMLAPSAQLVHLAEHYVLHHRAQGMRWLFDIAYLLVKHGTEIDWGDVCTAVHEFKMGRSLQFVIAEVEREWSVTLPLEAWEVMRRYRPTVGDRVTFRFMIAQHRSVIVAWNAWNTSGFRGKITYLVRNIFPGKHYMIQRYQISDVRTLPIFYARYFIRGVYAFVRSLISVVVNMARGYDHQRKR